MKNWRPNSSRISLYGTAAIWQHLLRWAEFFSPTRRSNVIALSLRNSATASSCVRADEKIHVMLKTDAAIPEGQNFVLSSLPPSPAQKRLALGIVLGLLVALYLVLGPFGGIQLGVVHSFVAIYTTAMFVTDTITAILLYAQFSILRSRAILVIASGYLFTAFLIVPYVLAFPGVLAPDGVVGGLQTSADLYLLWHCGFPLFVIGYALSKDEDPAQTASSWERQFSHRPECRLYCGRRDSGGLSVHQSRSNIPTHHARSIPLRTGVAVCRRRTDRLAVRLALAVLWLRRRSILDLFLMVVLCAY